MSIRHHETEKVLARLVLILPDSENFRTRPKVGGKSNS